MSARLVVPMLVVAMLVGGGSVASAEPVSLEDRAAVEAPDVDEDADGLVSFQWRTTVDATDVGGTAFEPLRLTYTFSSDLVPGSGFTGSGLHFSGYGPLSQMFLDSRNQCTTVSSPGTAITVFDDAGSGPASDQYDVRASTSVGATYSGRLFDQDLRFFQFVLVDTDSTIFSSTALPLTPDFAALAEAQQVELRLLDPVTQVSTSIFADSGFQLSLHRPVESLETLLGKVHGLDVSASLKKNLTNRLQSALDVLTDSTTGNDHPTANHLQKFIQLVDAQAGKKIPAIIADQLIAEALDVIDQLPPRGCA